MHELSLETSHHYFRLREYATPVNAFATSQFYSRSRYFPRLHLHATRRCYVHQNVMCATSHCYSHSPSLSFTTARDTKMRDVVCATSPCYSHVSPHFRFQLHATSGGAGARPPPTGLRAVLRAGQTLQRWCMPQRLKGFSLSCLPTLTWSMRGARTTQLPSPRARLP
jgi:hypothetical protein